MHAKYTYRDYISVVSGRYTRYDRTRNIVFRSAYIFNSNKSIKNGNITRINGYNNLKMVS